MKLYKYPMALTQQFKHCGNPFRIDSYKGCDFGCKYCFANCRGGNFSNNFEVADISIVENNFKKAFEDNKPTKNLTIELLRHKVPLHLGGLSDPFQKREEFFHNTYKILEISNKYNYPILISTKTANIPRSYFEILNPEIHAFQISLISLNENFIRKFETNTPKPQDRVNFIKRLKNKNFWVGIRIQPLIDINEAYNIVKYLSNIVNYITVEHIKIGNDNSQKKQMFIDMNLNPKDFVSCGREYELKTEIKKENIELLKSISNCPIGCGDNDLHELSDSNNCCGIDTINNNFSQWIKYNSMYINKTSDKTQWFPCNNCSSCVNNEGRIQGYCFKDYVDDYLIKPKKVGKCNVKL